MKKFLVFFLILFLAFCTPKKKVDITFQINEYEDKTKQADSLFNRGDYSSLKEAFRIYHDLLGLTYSHEKTKIKLIRTGFLLTLREKELGILEYKSFEEISRLIQQSPSLSQFSVFLDMVNSTPRKTKGFVTDFTKDTSRIDSTYEKLKKNVPLWAKKLKDLSGTDELYAYLYISLATNFSYYLGEEKTDFSPIVEIFSQHPSVQYISSIYPEENEEKLNAFVEKEPDFHEAYYFLGELALRHGQLVTAEKNFVRAYEHIPDSSAIIISLASIYFAFEEFTKSLELYERSLQMATEYRDAILGKAICLSYLGKNEEAIECCQKLIALGSFLLGEAHYWLAWNQNELEKLDEAWESIENTKRYLLGNSDVLSLSGIIAFKRGNQDLAEKNFLEALKLNPSDCEALFYLGNVYSRNQDWKKSGFYFGYAARCYERVENALNEKIKEIENSTLSEERKARLVLRKKAQLKKAGLTKATAFYNGAAGYFNAGMKKEALIFAQNAALHSALKEKAEELINNIKHQR